MFYEASASVNVCCFFATKIGRQQVLYIPSFLPLVTASLLSESASIPLYIPSFLPLVTAGDATEKQHTALYIPSFLPLVTASRTLINRPVPLYIPSFLPLVTARMCRYLYPSPAVYTIISATSYSTTLVSHSGTDI